MESLRGLGDLQGVNEFFLFAEKRIQRFDESRFQGGEMKWRKVHSTWIECSVYSKAVLSLQ